MTRGIPRPTRLGLLVVMLLSVIGCDQTTKIAATRTLRGVPAISLLGDTVRLQHALNPGAFLSLGTALSQEVRFWLFSVLTSGMLLAVGLVLVWRRRLDGAVFVALALVLAGGLGNLIDRWLGNGMVTDFLNVGVGSLRTGIFNVADVAITTGALLLMFCCWRPAGVAANPPHHP
jgi:signal peptidase II